MSVAEKALSTVRWEQMLSPNCAVVVGVSGGADSVTLLHLLHKWQEQGLFADLLAVHVHHGLRGAEAERDCHFVEDLCQRLAVPLVVERVDVAAVAKERGTGLEETGRALRYELFEKAASRFADVRVATAHTADDNAETLLLHLSRGSGLNGAVGIMPKRNNIIRPLISVTREEIETYCSENELEYVTDSTNTDEYYARNRIRASVMPQLKQINPQTVAAMARFTNLMRQTVSYFDAQIETVLNNAVDGPDSYRRSALRALEEPLLSMALFRIVKTAEERHVVLLRERLEQGSGSVVLPSGACWQVNETSLRYARPLTTYSDVYLPLTTDASCTMDGVSYRVIVLSKQEYEQNLNISPEQFSNALDYDTISGELFMRRRRDGDRFRPAGRGCGKTLKKLFNEKKTALRDTVPIVCDADGIVLVVGFGCDERVHVTDTTKRVWVLTKEEDVR